MVRNRNWYIYKKILILGSANNCETRTGLVAGVDGRADTSKVRRSIPVKYYIFSVKCLTSDVMT